MKLGPIGTNWISSLFIEAVKESKGIELTAVYSRSVQKAKDFAVAYNVPLYITDKTKMVMSYSIDCVLSLLRTIYISNKLCFSRK